MATAKITLENEYRKVEITETLPLVGGEEPKKHSLWQWKCNLIEPALKALTFSDQEELKEVMEESFKG